MKKIYVIMLSVLSLGLTSCDMDMKPYNAIPDTEALQSYNDFVNMRTGLYSPLRGMHTGSYVLATEIMADNFNAVVGYSNTFGDMYRWQFNTQTGDFESIWDGYQGLIGRCNHIIEYGKKVDLTDEEKFTDDQVTEIEQVIGEAYFLRAYSLYALAQFFCADYDVSTADGANTGVAYSTTYSPTSDNSAYPGRSTLAETYEQILTDVDSAKAKIPATPTSLTKANPQAYVSQDVITGFEARVALAMDDYDTAAEKAVELIEGGAYALCATEDELIDMWHNDNTAEAIWQLPIPSANEVVGSSSRIGSYFLPYTEGSTPDYIPSGDFINLFEAEDLRINAYFKLEQIVTTNGTSGYVYELNKFPDDSGIHQNIVKTEDGRFQSEPKIMRIAEMYLIAAEAYAKLGNTSLGGKYLNELQKNRFEDFIEVSYSNADVLMNEIKDERRREMVCEGTRLFDLKRWNMGVTRTTTQQDDLCLFPGSSVTTKLTKAANDYKMVLPIPKSEMDANPQVKQNPGY